MQTVFLVTPIFALVDCMIFEGFLFVINQQHDDTCSTILSYDLIWICHPPLTRYLLHRIQTLWRKSKKKRFVCVGKMKNYSKTHSAFLSEIRRHPNVSKSITQSKSACHSSPRNSFVGNLIFQSDNDQTDTTTRTSFFSPPSPLDTCRPLILNS